MVKRIFIDVETTGLSPEKNAIWQIAALLDIDGQIKDEINLRFRPNSEREIEAAALAVSGMTMQDLDALQLTHDRAYLQFVRFLDLHVSKYDKTDKAIFCAYNAYFDEQFVREWFLQNGDRYFGSYFHSGRIDVMSHALEALAEIRPTMPNFKLETVAEMFHLEPEGELHDAMTDIRITRQVYLAAKDAI